MKSVYFVFILLLFYACKNNTSEQHSADYYYNRGVLDYYKGDYKDALDNYNKAIALDSSISSYYSNRGVVREILLNDTLGALYDYKKAIQLNDQNSLAYYNVGCLLSDQGQDKEAIEFYKT